MNRKATFLALLVFSLGIFLVSNASMTPPEDELNSESYIADIYISKGWNIIAGTLPRGILADSEVTIDDISAIWYFSPKQEKYLQIYPEMDGEGFYYEDDDEVLTQAMWIYSKRSGTFKYSTLEDYPPFNDRKFYGGWNFVSITPEFKARKISEFQGECDIQKIADYQSGEWSVLTHTNPAWNDIVIADSDSDIGRGLLMKMKDDCNMELGSAVIDLPPQLPQ